MLAINHLLAIAMASAVASVAQPVDRPSAPPTTEVVVQNDENVPVTVYVEWGSEELRLGKVDAMDTAHLALPAWLITSEADVDIIVHPTRGFDQETGYLEVRRGDTIGVIVPARAHGAPRTVWPEQ